MGYTVLQTLSYTLNKKVKWLSDCHKRIIGFLLPDISRQSEQLKEAEKHKDALSSDIRTKKEYLESLQPKLSTILQVLYCNLSGHSESVLPVSYLEKYTSSSRKLWLKWGTLGMA